MQKNAPNTYLKFLSAILAILLFGQLQHARHQHSEIASLKNELSAAQSDVDKLEAQVTTIESELAVSRSNLDSANYEIDRLKTAASLAEISKSINLPGIGSAIGATGRCRDGTETFAINHRGACSWHGGVSYWY